MRRAEAEHWLLPRLPPAETQHSVCAHWERRNGLPSPTACQTQAHNPTAPQSAPPGWRSLGRWWSCPSPAAPQTAPPVGGWWSSAAECPWRSRCTPLQGGRGAGGAGRVGRSGQAEAGSEAASGRRDRRQGYWWGIHWGTLHPPCIRPASTAGTAVAALPCARITRRMSWTAGFTTLLQAVANLRPTWMQKRKQQSVLYRALLVLIPARLIY